MIRGGFLLPGQRAQLMALLRDGRAEQRLARRANAMLLLDDGWSCERVAKALYLNDRQGSLETAAGFHLFRVLESVLRRYYTHATGGKPAPKQRNISVYINAMRQAKCGEERVLATVKQISDHHRNPLSHPEAILTVDEAIAAAGIVRSAVTLMLASLPTPLPTVTSPLTATS
jgi:hypothetical protein